MAFSRFLCGQGVRREHRAHQFLYLTYKGEPCPGTLSVNSFLHGASAPPETLGLPRLGPVADQNALQS